MDATIQPLWVRVFIDFWNFNLSLRRAEADFRLNWKVVSKLMTREAGKLLDGQIPITFEAMHVYGSFDPSKPADTKFKNWFLTWLDRLPGVHTVLLERHRKHNAPHCPACQHEVTVCPSCSADMRGTEEKGLDTRIATDMISLAWSQGYDVAVLLSADRDFVPVADFLQSKGVKVVHAYFPKKGNELSQHCWASFGVLDLMEELRLPAL